MGTAGPPLRELAENVGEQDEGRTHLKASRETVRTPDEEQIQMPLGAKAGRNIEGQRRWEGRQSSHPRGLRVRAFILAIVTRSQATGIKGCRRPTYSLLLL